MSKYIIAITGCPTGIAHTFMAKESIEKAAKNMGYEVKVETNGQEGRKNELTYADLKRADALIVAADIGVDVERFLDLGVPVLQTGTKFALNEKAAEKLINEALSLPAKGDRSQIPEDKKETLTIGQKVYKDLMSGVSNMLPFVVGGGILIAMSFLWGIFSADPSSPEYNEFAAMLMKIGQQAFGIMVPVFTAYIAYSIAGRAGLVAGFVGGLLANETGAGFLGGIIAGFFAGYLMLYVGKLLSGLKREYEGLKSIFLMPLIGIFATGMFMLFLGKPVAGINEALMSWLSGLQNSNPLLLGLVVGMMCAFDFGGPVNKAAYVTGTILLAQGNYYFMAGVSAACITPPLVVALATTFFKKGFNEEERAAGVVNYILGATHITEGAIPFVAKDPIRMIPIMMIASSISAMLSYALLVTVPAPHGGFLILPLVNMPLTWVLCILAGSAVGAVMMGMLKLNVERKKALVYNSENKNTTENEQFLESSSSTMLDNSSNAPISFTEENVKIVNENISKENLLKSISDEMKSLGLVSDNYYDALQGREKQGNTYLEKGIAIPHGTKESGHLVSKTGVVVKFVPNGVDWGDGNTAKLIVGIVSNNQCHIDMLKTITELLSDEHIEDRFAEINTTDDLLELLCPKESTDKDQHSVSNNETETKEQVEESTFEVLNQHGLHTRPCAVLVKDLKTKFPEHKIEVRKANDESAKSVNAKSMLNVTKLGLRKGDFATITVIGKNPAAVLEEIKVMFENKFGEQ